MPIPEFFAPENIQRMPYSSPTCSAIERPGPLSLSRHCELLGLSRAALYYQRVEVGAYELELMALVDRQYLRTPFTACGG